MRFPLAPLLFAYETKQRKNCHLVSCKWRRARRFSLSLAGMSPWKYPKYLRSLPPNRVISIYSCIPHPPAISRPPTLLLVWRGTKTFFGIQMLFLAQHLWHFSRGPCDGGRKTCETRKCFPSCLLFLLLLTPIAWETLWATTATTRLKVLAKLFGFYCRTETGKGKGNPFRGRQRVKNRVRERKIFLAWCALWLLICWGFPWLLPRGVASR